MRHNGKGGMQTSGAGGSIICPKCGKPAARRIHDGQHEAYMHYTTTGSLWHTRDADGGWRTGRQIGGTP